jgi:hypothetical protein
VVRRATATPLFAAQDLFHIQHQVIANAVYRPESLQSNKLHLLLTFNCERYHLSSYPNPIRWLEAQLEDELRLAQMGAGHSLGQPYKGKVDGDFVAPVVDWEMLKGFVWNVQGRYPRRFVPSVSENLTLAISRQNSTDSCPGQA